MQFFPDTYIPSDQAWAWSGFEKMMRAVSQITRLASIFEDFMYRAYLELFEDNVQYIEFRTGLGPKCRVRYITVVIKMSLCCSITFFNVEVFHFLR